MNVLLFSARRAAWESDIILTYLGLCSLFSKKNSQPVLIPISSAWKTVAESGNWAWALAIIVFLWYITAPAPTRLSILLLLSY